MPNIAATPTPGGGTTTTTYSEIEHYIYDADGQRAARVAGSQTTVYFQGVWEDVLGVDVRKLYTFNNQVVAQRAGAGTVTYLHGDNLGSISVTTDANGNLASKQEFDPWGKVRSGGVSQTTLNYTGQRLDSTGLLFYNARYYDPALGRFISADSVVPGNASGSMDGVALRPLTVDFHEPGLVGTLNSEGAHAGKLHWGGPLNPQSLNRYSYVQNNPMGATDSTGHSIYLSHNDAEAVAQAFEDLAYNRTYEGNTAADTATDIVTVIASNLTGPAGAFLGEVGSRLLDLKEKGINKLYELAKIIRAQNGVDGVALGGSGNTHYDSGVYVMDRNTGKAPLVAMEYGVYLTLFRNNHELDIGMAFGDDVGHGHYAFADDVDGKYFGADRPVCRAEGANDC